MMNNQQLLEKRPDFKKNLRVRFFIETEILKGSIFNLKEEKMYRWIWIATVFFSALSCRVETEEVPFTLSESWFPERYQQAVAQVFEESLGLFLVGTTEDSFPQHTLPYLIFHCPYAPNGAELDWIVSAAAKVIMGLANQAPQSALCPSGRFEIQDVDFLLLFGEEAYPLREEKKLWSVRFNQGYICYCCTDTSIVYEEYETFKKRLGFSL